MSKRKAPPFVRDHVTSLIARHRRKEPSLFKLGDLDESMRSILRTVEPYTLTSDERVASLFTSVDYIVEHDIPGAFVESGLWRGGSLMAMLLRLRHHGICDRDIVGFDTFTDEFKPTDEDVDFKGRPAGSSVNKLAFEIGSRIANFGISRDEVFARLASTGYPSERIHLVAGAVEDTLPAHAPETVALLRLDTDWYVSTRHELEHLYPRVAIGGVLVIDDYGHFKGQQKAVDEYFQGHRILLQRVDYSCRLAVKQQER